jgi:hypothetical protein
MENSTTTLPPDYWTQYTPSKTDIDFISNYLFEKEIPLTEKEIVPILVEERIARERVELLKKQKGGSKTYLPKEKFKKGDSLAFPALGWRKGTVGGVRPGSNPSIGEFEVIEVTFEDGTLKRFATNLANHALNEEPEISVEDESLNAKAIITNHGSLLESAITKGLQSDENLVQVAGRWFPRALLVNIHVGHLNLAEAILDEAGGKPLATDVILEQVGLPGNDNSSLEAFSMNYALQEDGRFDEVGPAGEVLWCLKRLEPADVQLIPQPLRYVELPYDRALMTKEMLALETQIDDELGESEAPAKIEDEVTITLTYPHWRAGTLPVSIRTRQLFPTAYESERVRFVLVDAAAKEEIPAWVVRKARYVAGMKNVYQKYGTMPGSLVTLRRGKKPGQVIFEARTRRPTRDWVRTVLVGSDGGLVFANLKQNLTTEFNDMMVVAVPDVAGVDAACEQIHKQKIPFDKLVANMMKELTKLNVQGHIHAQEVYSALNIIKRCPVGPLLVHLAQTKGYKHVGDLHYRITEVEEANE